jgi:hypothetical protein
LKIFTPTAYEFRLVPSRCSTWHGSRDAPAVAATVTDLVVPAQRFGPRTPGVDGVLREEQIRAVSLWLPKHEYFAEQQARRFTIVSVAEARERTGLEVDQLQHFGAELLTKQFDDGRQEQALRLPAEFVPGDQQR